MSLLDTLDKEILVEPANGKAATSAGRVSYSELLSFASAGIPEGQRNASFTRFAGFLRARGLDVDISAMILKSINTTTKTGLPDAEIDKIAKSVQRYQPKPENRLPREADVITFAEARDAYYENRKLWGSCRTGYEHLDKILFAMTPKDVFVIAARSGCLKTTLGLTLLNNMGVNMKARGLFISLEMGRESLFFRGSNMHLSRANGKGFSAADTSDYLGTDYERGEAIVKAFENVLLVDSDSQTIEQVEEHLINARQKINADIPLMTIDYIGYLRDTQSGSNYEQVSRIAKQVKALAKRQNIRIILLCQTSREGEDGTVPVKLHHLRDSGAIEESADWVLGLWHSKDEAHRLHAEMLKTRHGERGKRFDFVNEGLNLVESDYLPDARKGKPTVE